jgi:hypothetical protein
MNTLYRVLASGKVTVAVGVADMEELSMTATLSIQTYTPGVTAVYTFTHIIQTAPHVAAAQGWGV